MPKDARPDHTRELFPIESVQKLPTRLSGFLDQVRSFDAFGKPTQVEYVDGLHTLPIAYHTNEFWTSKQRDAHSIHEVSYRACFKPQLPAFFIDRLTEPGDIVHDPFTGRGTTLVEAALLERVPSGNDANPLSKILTQPRLDPPDLEAILERLDSLDLDGYSGPLESFLIPFYHPETARHIHALRNNLLSKADGGTADGVDSWIQMVATNRLTGHSPGFFSVYTMPPNQAVTADRQRLINEKRSQVPPIRDIKAIIGKKTQTLLKDIAHKRPEAETSDAIRHQSADETLPLKRNSVALVVTSPPFIDTVDYKTDNWLRCWFNGIDSNSIDFWQFRKPEDWVEAMLRTLRALHRILKPGGVVAFEVGEVRKGKILLEQLLLPHLHTTGLHPLMVMVNQQDFTKTANTWGVHNKTAGTNTNRTLVLFKPE